MSKPKQTAITETYRGIFAGIRQENIRSRGIDILAIPKDILIIHFSYTFA